MLRLGIGGEGGRRVTMEAIRRKEKEAEGKGKERLATHLRTIVLWEKDAALYARIFFRCKASNSPQKIRTKKRIDKSTL